MGLHRAPGVQVDATVRTQRELLRGGATVAATASMLQWGPRAAQTAPMGNTLIIRMRLAIIVHMVSTRLFIDNDIIGSVAPVAQGSGLAMGLLSAPTAPQVVGTIAITLAPRQQTATRAQRGGTRLFREEQLSATTFAVPGATLQRGHRRARRVPLGGTRGLFKHLPALLAPWAGTLQARGILPAQHAPRGATSLLPVAQAATCARLESTSPQRGKSFVRAVTLACTKNLKVPSIAARVRAAPTRFLRAWPCVPLQLRQL